MERGAVRAGVRAAKNVRTSAQPAMVAEGTLLPQGVRHGSACRPGQYSARLGTRYGRRVRRADLLVTLCHKLRLSAPADRRSHEAGAGWAGARLATRRCYWISTEAPASSSCDLIESASSWATPSLTGFGAESTRSFASFRPSPVIARTTLITWIFCWPAPVRTTSNAVFSSTAGPPPSAPGAAATATGAAAVIPHSSSILFLSSTSSSTVMLPSCSKTVSTAAISMPPACLGWIRVLREPPRRPRPPAAPRAAAPPQVRARAPRLRAASLLLRAPCLLQAPRLPRAEPPPREPRPRRPAPPAARSGRRSARGGSAAVR